MGLPFDILTTAVRSIIYYLILQGIFLVIPQLRGLLYAISFPFHYLHVWLHVESGKKIAARRFREGMKETEKPILNSVDNSQFLKNIIPNNVFKERIANFYPKARYATGLGVNREGSIIQITCESPNEARSIALAPLKGSIPIFIGMIFAGPLLLPLGFLGFLIHFYFNTVCMGVLMPSSDDLRYIYDVSLIKTHLSPFYLLWTVVIFIVFGYDSLSHTGDPFLSLVDGIAWSLGYIAVLLSTLSFIIPVVKRFTTNREDPEEVFLLPRKPVTSPSSNKQFDEDDMTMEIMEDEIYA